MGELLEIAKVMVEPATKLMEMCGNAIGTVYEPRHVRKMADAEAYKIRQLGAAISESNGLPVSYENGSLSMSTEDFEDIAKRAEFRANYQLLCEQKNIEKVVENAYQGLLDAPAVSNTPVDEDWSTRFFNIVKDVSSDEMQHIWSKILAGEVEKPGSFSMRTLETIRNLSRAEAMTFQKLAPFIVMSAGSACITSEASVYQKYGITYDDIMLLDECGLMVSESSLQWTLTFESGAMIMYNDAYCAISEGASEETVKIDFGIHSLTNAGRELFRILSHESNKAYFVDFVEQVFKKNRHVKIQVYEVTKIGNDSVDHKDMIVREFCEKKGSVQ